MSSSKKGPTNRAIWCKVSDKIFIVELLSYVRKGKFTKTGNQFPHEAWTNVTAKVNKHSVNAHGYTMSKDQIKNRYYALKMSLTVFRALLKADGFHWDREAKRIIAEDEVWANYLKRIPVAGPFRRNALENYKELRELFGVAPHTPARAQGGGSNSVNHGRAQRPADWRVEGGPSQLSRHPEIIVLDGPEMTPTSSPLSQFSANGNCLPSTPSVGSQVYEQPGIAKNTPVITESSSTRFANPLPTRPSIAVKAKIDNPRPTSPQPRMSDTVNSTLKVGNQSALDGMAPLVTNEMSASGEANGSGAQTKTVEIPAQYILYTKAVTKVIKLYTDGKVSKEAVRISSAVFKHDPHECLLFDLMPEDLCLGWVEECVRKNAECTTLGGRA
ncbi:hypothetical protein L873DRAFT_1787416 [Choiromyces venosus 120613-1]|uniref:Myb/SANT-like domain-containing protein n=1 Tax=Choiromyces venosus 120613-1 TaxID=1336337 RepID=A0A3N4KAK1_9PEZI|nr:hypothetical protein L873DRAFT_1787416 [Choiromyces venosus 120613-1]